MALVAVRLNSIEGNPFTKDGEIKEDGWEILDRDEFIVFVDTADVFDILNGTDDVRDALDNWKDDA